MRNPILITLIFIFLFINVAFGETSIKAEIDKTLLTTDETLTYKLTVTSAERQVPPAHLPKFEGFNVLSTAETSNISVARGKLSTSLVYVFVLAPNETGKFKIEPSQIKIKDQVYSSDAFEIEVTPGKTKVKPKPEQPSLPQELPLESEESQVTL